MPVRRETAPQARSSGHTGKTIDLKDTARNAGWQARQDSGLCDQRDGDATRRQRGDTAGRWRTAARPRLVCAIAMLDLSRRTNTSEKDTNDTARLQRTTTAQLATTIKSQYAGRFAVLARPKYERQSIEVTGRDSQLPRLVQHESLHRGNDD